MLTGDSGDAGLALDDGLGELVGLGLMMLSLETEKTSELPLRSSLSPTLMPGTLTLVAPATSGRALAADTAPAAMTPTLRAEAAPIAIQFFASMMKTFLAVGEPPLCRGALCCGHTLSTEHENPRRSA